METNGILPAQLQNINFGFVKLGKRSKMPFEKNWQNNPYAFEEIQLWVDQGGNYGVLGGHGNLVVIDDDTGEIGKIVQEKLPPTFIVKSSRWCHYYYICKGIKNKIVLMKDKKHYGDIISKGSQVVGAGSIHPDTGTEYEVVNDIEIAEISQEDIFTHFA